ncbi:hypothetical protein M2404_001078 [Rheinheimera pacifica]|nr:hypothetical protein [Rheinheimera pacifica]
MRIFLLIFATLLQASVVFSADINCKGKVTRLMDYPQ